MMKSNCSRIFQPLFLACCAILVAGLAGCSQERTPVGEPTVEPMATTVPTAPTAAANEEASAQPLPPGVSLTFPHDVVSDRMKDAGEARQRRRIVFRVGLDIDPLVAQVASAMAEAGYEEKGRKDGQAGKFTVQYRKPGVGAVYVGYNPDAGKKGGAVDAGGAASLVAFDWVVPAGGGVIPGK